MDEPVANDSDQECVASERDGEDRRSEEERRSVGDRRVNDQLFEGPDRRKGDRRSPAEMDRRSGWDRRRGPGIRRSEERRAAEEGEMNDEQFEFIRAIEEYKRVNRRPFPTFTEVLEIAKALGYRKVAEPQSLVDSGEEGDSEE